MNPLLAQLLDKHRWKLAVASVPLLVLAATSVLIALYTLPVGAGRGDAPAGRLVLHGAFHARAETLSGDDRRAEVIEAANALKLDFVVLASSVAEPAQAAYASGVLVIPAVEIALDGGELLLFGADAQVAPGLPVGDGNAAVRARAAAGSVHVGVLSRPLSWFHGWDQRAYHPALRKHDTVPRVIDDVPRLGIEFLAASVEHENEFVSPYLPAAWFYWTRIFNDDYAALGLYDRPQDALESWDALSGGRPWPAPGFCAADAQHQIRDQELALRTLGTYVHIPEDTPPQGRRAAVDKALRTGWHHCAVDLIGTAPDFDFRVVDASRSRFWPMGDRARFAEGLVLKIRAPQLEDHSVRVSVFRDGQLMALRPVRNVDMPVLKPGIYRVEVDVYLDHPVVGGGWVTWIYSNPISVTQSAIPDLPAGSDPTANGPPG